QKLTLSDRVFTIVGVLPESFRFGNKPALLLPLRLTTENAPDGLNFLSVIGKLRPGLTMMQAQTALKVALPQVQKTATQEAGVTITPLQKVVAGRSRPLLLALLGAVSLVLMISCFNIANLLLARAASREKEIAIRMSLGARRTRLVRQMLTE